MNIENYINNELRSRIQADGGEISFISFDNDCLKVLFQGECSKCRILDRCISWIEDDINCKFGKRVKISAERKKPFFWDFG